MGLGSIKHHGRVFQSTSSGEWNLLEVGFFHQVFLMDKWVCSSDTFPFGLAWRSWWGWPWRLVP